MITAFWWRSEDKQGVWLDGDQFRARLDALKATDDVVWVDLERPTPDEVKLVYHDFCKVHTLTLEDITRPEREPHGDPHFPKVEEFPDYLFVITNPLVPNLVRTMQTKAVEVNGPKKRPFRRHAEPVITKARAANQLTAVLTQRLLVTHHYGGVDAVASLKQHLQKHEGTCERGPDYLFHLVLDAMVDQYAPVLDHFDASLDEVEGRVFSAPTHRLLMRMLQLKREIIVLRKTLVYEREVLARLCRGEFELIGDREVVYYRNVYDHLVRFTELIEGSREMVTDLLQTHLSAASNKLNEIMKVLAMISTIILPMTLIAGIYGMNFELWPDDTPGFGAFWFALGLMGLVGVAAMAYFKWKKWF
jgi:magnesium transporter